MERVVQNRIVPLVPLPLLLVALQLHLFIKATTQFVHQTHAHAAPAAVVTAVALAMASKDI
jgi:hypothetical protein